MFSKYNEDAQKVLIMAKKEMSDLKHPYVGSEHLLLAILKQNKNISDRLLKYGLTYQSFRNELIKIIGVGTSENDWFLYTPLLKRVLDNATMISKNLGSVEVNVIHLILSLIEEGDGVALRVLSNMDIDIDRVYEEFSTKAIDKKDKYRKKLMVEEFGVDLTKKAEKGEIDPVIGRDNEIDRLIQILSRRIKNNPLLIGDAGVGKTAIVEELARRITNSDVPESLINKRIISVEIASLVAGTKYRGEFEERINKILREIETRDDVILFIDEVHTLVGAGGAEGAIDASNILKPALSRGKIKLIGATTLDEYKKTIEKDRAFDRRFQKVEIFEPDFNKTLDILIGLKDLYCSYHNVKIEDNLLKEIIKLTNKYMYDNRQPDKSIDILDEVCVRVSLTKKNNDNSVIKLKNELSDLLSLKNGCIINKDFKKALELREEQTALEAKINKMELKNISSSKMRYVTLNDVIDVIQHKTHIPIYDFNKNGYKELSKIEDKLIKKIKGQDEAIRELCDLTKRIKLGFRTNDKPASFLFVGPTGVGKTYLVKEYSKLINGDNNLIRLDMSEYRESHTISKIIGSPSGYVGYDDGKNVLEEIRHKPYSVILLDEIEKAHPSVLNLFLQILDEGFIKDSVGRTIRFDNSIIIMTSNIGFGKDNIGFSKSGDSIESKLKEFLSIEFINRLDKVIVFNKLNKKVVQSIVNNKISIVKDKFMEKGIKLNINKKVFDEIVELSNYEEFGARKVDKIISDKIDTIVINNMLLGKESVEIGTIIV